MVAVGFSICALWNRAPDVPQRTTRTSINLPEGLAVPVRGEIPFAWSRDGRVLAFTAGSQASLGWRLYIRELDQFEGRLIENVEMAVSPFFSPDGQFIGYFDQGRSEIRKVGRLVMT